MFADANPEKIDLVELNCQDALRAYRARYAALGLGSSVALVVSSQAHPKSYFP